MYFASRCEFDGVQHFGERTDLVHFHENRVGRAGINALLEELHIGDEQIVADDLDLVADLRSGFSSPLELRTPDLFGYYFLC